MNNVPFITDHCPTHSIGKLNILPGILYTWYFNNSKLLKLLLLVNYFNSIQFITNFIAELVSDKILGTLVYRTEAD